MDTVHFEPNSMPEVARRIFNAAFPSYTGRKFKVTFADAVHVNNLWSGGTRDVTRFVRLADMATLDTPDTYHVGTQDAPLADGLVAVQHSIFCGDDMGLEIIAPKSARGSLALPEVTLTRDESIVLDATRSYKSSYAGQSNYRFREAASYSGITAERWEAAKAACIAKGFLNKAGAITPSGKNAVGDFRVDRCTK